MINQVPQERNGLFLFIQKASHVEPNSLPAPAPIPTGMTPPHAERGGCNGQVHRLGCLRLRVLNSFWGYFSMNQQSQECVCHLLFD